MRGVTVASHNFNAMNDLASTAGKLTRARYKSCPRSCGSVPAASGGLIDMSGPAQHLHGRVLFRLLAPPVA
ncbi:MAG: hypothetical protein WB698_13730 [Solirubrobacteraceae bacterium]